MKNLRLYGKPPYSVAVIHGGPGARGDMASVARELSKTCGILEPLQSAVSINGQVNELKLILKKYAKFPVVLIGHSWGAWLSYIFTVRNPTQVKKLILVSSGPLEEKYVPAIMKTRLKRLKGKEREELDTYIALMNGKKVSKERIKGLVTLTDQGVEFMKFDTFIQKTDSYRPIYPTDKINFRLDIMQGVWPEADKFRQAGTLLLIAKNIKCPVTAIHGDYDPHPYQGIKKPLSQHIKDFSFVRLEKCGHTPWLEQYARDKFYQILIKELT